MKSIENTLKLIGELKEALAGKDPVLIALIGGYACIAHGVGRTTMDVDFAFYAGAVPDEEAWLGRLRDFLSEEMKVTFVQGSKMPDDPFGHDIIFLEDTKGEYPRIDLILPKYKWELEGIRAAAPLEDIPFPVLSKPYLVAMKLTAGSPKDDADILELVALMTEAEKEKTSELSRRIHRDRKLIALITSAGSETIPEDPEQLLDP